MRRDHGPEEHHGRLSKSFQTNFLLTATNGYGMCVALRSSMRCGGGGCHRFGFKKVDANNNVQNSRGFRQHRQEPSLLSIVSLASRFLICFILSFILISNFNIFLHQYSDANRIGLPPGPPPFPHRLTQVREFR
jgi:hypothetical protein